MSRKPRYELEDVETHGYRVARIRDNQTGEISRVRLKGTRCLHWDLSDKAVEEIGLRRAAREALADG